MKTIKAAGMKSVIVTLLTVSLLLAQSPLPGPFISGGGSGGSGSSVRSMSYMFSGSDIVAGNIGGGFTMPSTCTLAAWDIDTKANDTATIKVLKIATGTTSPVIGNSINTSGVSISSNGHVHSTVLSDFTTTTFSQYDIVAFDLLATGGVATKVVVSLSFTGCQ